MATNIANIVFPGHFNPKTDKWCDYKEQLQCALDAAGVSESEYNSKARSLFLSQCGKDTYSLIASLLAPARPTSVEFNEILSVLDKFFEPEVNEILESDKFHKRRQSPDDTVQDFVAAISLLGVKCNLTDLKRQLRDRLVLGIRDERFIISPDSVPSNTEIQLEAAAHRTPACTFAEGLPVLIRMYGPGEKWQRATVEMTEGPSSYMVQTEDGELHLRHTDQTLARTATPQVIDQDPIADDRTSCNSRSGTVTPDMPIEIPPPELWPDIVEIPSTD